VVPVNATPRFGNTFLIVDYENESVENREKAYCSRTRDEIIAYLARGFISLID
jgi:hypothetical protein